MKKNITREALFALVWEKPTIEVAQELGVSDVAVAKLCARMQVPKPPRGYWARVRAGGQPRRPALQAFREAQEARRGAGAAMAPGGLRLSPIQKSFFAHALERLAAQGVDVEAVRMRSEQVVGLGPDIAAQALLLIQNQHRDWVRKGAVPHELTPGALRSLGGLVDKLLPLARPQCLLLEPPPSPHAFGPRQDGPMAVIRLTAPLLERIAQLSRLVRAQRLEHVALPLGAADHAWIVHHVWSRDRFATATSLICVSEKELWVECRIAGLRDDVPEKVTTQSAALHEIMPLELMQHKEIAAPAPLRRAHLRDHWPRLRALIEAERVLDMLQQGFWDVGRAVHDDTLVVADRLWFGEGRPLSEARSAAEAIEADLQRWEEALETEREELGALILGISPGDILVHPEARAASRLLVSSVRVNAGEKTVFFVIDGCRFRKDGLPGKRREAVYLHFGDAEG